MSKPEQPINDEMQQETMQPEVEVISDDIEITEEEALLSRIMELESQLAAAEDKASEQNDGVLRARAEMENVRRRSDQEVDKARKFALNKFAEELLPVIDNLERALESADKENDALKPMIEGVELTLKTMVSTVEKFGVECINPMGDVFNPEFHQAMSIQESADHESNTVMMVMQKGYRLNGRVVRPAMVMVAK
jgi:molecular chaperone GrpE